MGIYMILYILIGCNSEESKNIKKEFYKNGKLFKEYSVNKKDIKEGDFKEYYENGKIKKKYKYLNGKLEGEQKEFYESGTLKSKGYYINGVLDSLIYHYYTNGNIEQESFRFEGKLFGAQKEFDVDGNLTNMNFKVNDSEWVSSLDFDKSGSIIKKAGSLIYCIAEKRENSIKDTLGLLFYIMVPPLYTSKSQVLEIKDGGIIDKQDCNLVDVNNNKAFLFKRRFNETGNYIVRFKLILSQPLSKASIKDSLDVNLNLK